MEKTKKRPFSSPGNSPSPTQLISQEETYSNPLKKKARVSLYKKSSPPLSRPHSISPLRNDQPLPVGTPPSGTVLSSSTVVDLGKLVPASDLENQLSDRHHPKKSRDNHGNRPLGPESAEEKRGDTDLPSNNVNPDDYGRRSRNRRLPHKSEGDSSMKKGRSSDTHPSMYDATIIPSPGNSPSQSPCCGAYCFVLTRLHFSDDSSSLSASASDYEEFIR